MNRHSHILGSLARGGACLLLIGIMAGCPDRPATQSSPAPAATPTPASAPPPLTDADIQNSIGPQLDLMYQARLAKSCALPPTAAQPPGTGTFTGPLPGQPAVVNGYSAWTTYIASHLRTGTPFGADYPGIAAGALDTAGMPDSTMDACRNRAPNVLTQQAILELNPEKLGEALYNQYSNAHYDQPTLDRIALFIQTH